MSALAAVAVCLGLVLTVTPGRSAGAPADTHRPPSSGPDRWVMSALAVALVAAVSGRMTMAVLVAGLALAIPHLRRWLDARRHERALDRAIPDVIEMLALSIGAGASTARALEIAAEFGPEIVADSARRARHVMGSDGARAGLLVLGEATFHRLDAVIEVLLAAERDGAPVALVLDRLGKEASTTRRRLVEERARKTPVLLVLPLAALSLPAVFVGTVAPLVLITFGETPF